MKEMAENIRIPFLLCKDNPKHQFVLSILEQTENRSAYIREAIIYYHRHHGVAIKEDGVLEDIRMVVQECNQKLLLEIDKRLEDKKEIDYDKFKNMF